ncbi:MAG: peptidoglycan DD-metalloendopeptidase family protein [Proteobacteria bacterium]|nr:peptidoglycan DD-metalloendopeptidase family protein [Pseudomonadota bacterium]
MISRQCCYFLATLLSATLLSSCAGNGKPWNPEDYTVKSGDTLYSIAWRYELDIEEFTAWNGLGLSTFIKPGQRLHTRKPAGFDKNKAYGRSSTTDAEIAYVQPAEKWSPATSRTQKTQSKQKSSNEKWIRAQKGDSLYSISRDTGVSVQQLVRLNQLKKPYTIHPGQTIFLKPLKSSSQGSGKASTAQSNRSATAQKTQSKVTAKSTAGKINWPKRVRWQKPAKGKIIKKYKRNRNDAKGIDIAGRKGDAIVAAASGKVVYSGSGLISYGKLIIIKHNKTYLSAYAYNRKLLVKEGQMVNAGQKIAEMGHKDKSSPRLHFEIRKNGKPVDPLKYLPW